MTTETKTAPKKFRRKTKAELGQEIESNVKTKDREIHKRLRSDFPKHAEVQLRPERGRHRHTPIDVEATKRGKKRVDFFNLTYVQQCSFPAVDSVKDEGDGQWIERCEFVPPQKNSDVSEDIKKLYKQDKNRKGIFKSVSLKQFAVLWHCKDHYAWWAEENGKLEQRDGKAYRRPPTKFIVNTPDWEEE